MEARLRAAAWVSVGALALVMNACGTSGSGGTSSSGPTTPTVTPTIPATCPATPVKVPYDTVRPTPAIPIAPADAIAAYVCVYPGQGETLKSTDVPIRVDDVPRSVDVTNSMLTAPVKTYSCPPGDGGVDVIAFERPTGDVAFVEVDRNGCQWAVSSATSGVWDAHQELGPYLRTIEPSFPL